MHESSKEEEGERTRLLDTIWLWFAASSNKSLSLSSSAKEDLASVEDGARTTSKHITIYKCQG